MRQSFRLSVHMYLSISQELNMTKLLLMLKRAQSIRLIYMYTPFCISTKISEIVRETGDH